MSCVLLVLFILGLTVPAFAQTEKEIVSQYLQKYEKERIKKIGFLVLNGSYGRLNPENDYNNFALRQSSLITDLSGGTEELERVYRSKELFLGFGMMVAKKSAVTVGLNYWLKMGSSNVGDYNISLNLSTAEDEYDYELKSEVRVYGFSAHFDQYLINAPDNSGYLNGFALKAGLGVGYYFANWELWDGFAGYNETTGEPEIVNGNLDGSTLGFTVGLSGEMPLPVAGLILEASAKYLYLNFGNVTWYNSNDEEVVAQFYDEQVELDLSGPRAQIGFKRYFAW